MSTMIYLVVLFTGMMFREKEKASIPPQIASERFDVFYLALEIV